jgi:hypothetical protein
LVVKNDGVLPQYYIENSHPAIVSKEIYQMAQQEFRRRENTKSGKMPGGANPLTGKIVCSSCGGLFGSKVWHSTSKYRRVVWRCNEKYKTKGAKVCDIPHVSEDTIKVAFVDAFNDIFTAKDEILAQLEILIGDALAADHIDRRAAVLQAEVDELETDTRALIDRNARIPMNQDDYLKEYETLASAHKEKTEALHALAEQRINLESRKQMCRVFLDELKSQYTALAEFDEPLWNLLVESVTVHAGRLVFAFKNGMEIEKNI